MYSNAVLHTNKSTRASTLQNTIEIYNNRMLADSSKMILRGQSVADDLIMTMSREDGTSIGDYGFYKRIIAARDRKDPSYYKWDEATERQIQAAAEEAEVQAAYGAGKESGGAKNFSGRSLSVLEDPALSIQTQPNGSSSAPRQIDLLDLSPLCDIEDGYASDPEDPVQPSDILCPRPVQAILQDEDSRDSSESLGNASSVSLSPRDNKLYKAVKNLIGPLAVTMDMLSKESKTRDYLTSNNESKDGVIADLKHKHKSREGKTAAQTRKLNLAVQRETNALEEAEMERKLREKEEELREKADVYASTLLIANAGLSIAAMNHSTGDKVCLFI
jgi:hypothetical protein